MTRRIATMLMMVLAVAPGCSDGGGGGSTPADTAGDGVGFPDGGDVTPGDGDASEDSGPVTPLCLSDADCTGAGEICACTGECVAPAGNPCNDDKNCAPGNWCDPCIGRCAPKVELCDPCTDSGACGDGAKCLPYASGGTYCGKACISDAGCPIGFTCADTGGGDKQCVPKSGDCADLGLCEDDGDCPDAQICNDALKVCAPGCTDDGQCPQGLVCVAARCEQPCTGNAECEAPKECLDGKCKIPGACDSSQECTQPETYCSKTTGMCEPGCLVDDDCQDAAKECEAGSCVAKGCEHHYQCAFEQECDKATGQCVPMTRDHCAPCDASGENQCGGDPNLCVTFQDEDEVEQGDFCLLTCEEDEIDKCPSGYGCQKIESDDGSVNGFYCVRQCYEQPVSAP